VPDDLWALAEPILPKHPPSPKGGKPRKPDRLCLTGILFVLKTGIPWEDFPPRDGLRCMGKTNGTEPRGRIDTSRGVDAGRVPLGATLTAANRHYVTQLIPRLRDDVLASTP
jgi:hypothetical protein